MSTKFRLEPLPIEDFLPLFKLGDVELHKRSAKWLVSDAKEILSRVVDGVSPERMNKDRIVG